mmetsp:Transcript_10948/g.31742  ORF Transcript_10948/g.31742 Transcript_10948/m.31742 type:complete len:211 (-) Transcript_10948:880-1512(-)
MRGGSPTTVVLPLGGVPLSSRPDLPPLPPGRSASSADVVSSLAWSARLAVCVALVTLLRSSDSWMSASMAACALDSLAKSSAVRKSGSGMGSQGTVPVVSLRWNRPRLYSIDMSALKSSVLMTSLFLEIIQRSRSVNMGEKAAAVDSCVLAGDVVKKPILTISLKSADPAVAFSSPNNDALDVSNVTASILLSSSTLTERTRYSLACVSV